MQIQFDIPDIAVGRRQVRPDECISNRNRSGPDGGCDMFYNNVIFNRSFYIKCAVFLFIYLFSMCTQPLNCLHANIPSHRCYFLQQHPVRCYCCAVNYYQDRSSLPTGAWIYHSPPNLPFLFSVYVGRNALK